jgi:transposase
MWRRCRQTRQLFRFDVAADSDRHGPTNPVLAPPTTAGQPLTWSVQAVDVRQQEMVPIVKPVTSIAMAPRRQHQRSLKTGLVAQNLMPGASVAAIASAGGLNTNLLFKWRRDHLRSARPSGSTLSVAGRVPVPVASVVGGQGGGGAQQLQASRPPHPGAVAGMRTPKSP